MQLNKYLARCGTASRRKAVELITSGRVRVNGTIVQNPGSRVDPENDAVFLDGVRLRARRRFRYVLLNKPAGVLTTVSDERGRKSVMDLIPERQGLFPVGRLDKNTEGVLLLTDDGDLAYRLTHPKFMVEKTYEAWVSGCVDAKTVGRLEKGVAIDEGPPVRGKVQILKTQLSRSLLRIRIHEGRKRQVRLMLEAAGHPVIRLERVRFADLTVEGLKKGGWRMLRPDEVRKLYKMTGLAPVKNDLSTNSIHGST